MTYTRGQIRDIIRQRCDMENTTAQVDAELNNIINDSASYVHDFLIATLQHGYAAKTSSLTVTANTASYSLAAITDFYRPFSVRLQFDDLSYPIGSFSPQDQVLRRTARSWGPGYLPVFYIAQSAASAYTMEFDPPPDQTYTVQIRYFTAAPTYTSDSDQVLIPYTDLLIAEACIRVKTKEERDPSYFLGEREAIKKRIEDWVGNMNAANPPTTLWAPRGGRASWRRERIF